MKKKQPATLQQFSQFFNVPITAVYVIALAVIGLAGVMFTSFATYQQQQTLSSANTAQAPVITCNSVCSHNHQCQANHFCFNGRCRLVTVPEDPTCGDTKGGVTQPAEDETAVAPTIVPTATVAPTIEATDSAQATETSPVVPPIINDPNRLNSLQGRQQDQLLETDTTQENESKLAFIFEYVEQFLSESDTSIFFVLGIGVVGLILLIAIISFISAKKKSSYTPTNFNDLESTQFNNNQTTANSTIPVNASSPVSMQAQETTSKTIPTPTQQEQTIQPELISRLPNNFANNQPSSSTKDFKEWPQEE